VTLPGAFTTTAIRWRAVTAVWHAPSFAPELAGAGGFAS